MVKKINHRHAAITIEAQDSNEQLSLQLNFFFHPFYQYGELENPDASALG